MAVPIKELPPEIWKKILSEVDEPGLMNCRLVNRCWRDLGNEILRETSSLWKPTFVNSLISKRLGTHFSAPDQITRFMEEMKGAPNPFPNGSVIFMPDRNLTKDQRITFQLNLYELLDTFKESILNLVYSVLWNRENEDLSHQFGTILKLKRLKSLVIAPMGNYCWDALPFFTSNPPRNLFKDMLESNEIILFPEKLTELSIAGNNGIIPLSYVFGGFESIRKSVLSLEIVNDFMSLPRRFNPMESLDFPMCQFPNLKRLSVCFASAEFLQHFQQFQPNCVASLKEVSFHFVEYQYPGLQSNLKETFELLDLHAETLEFLELEFGPIVNEIYPVCVYGLFTPVKYAKLKTLLIHVLQYDLIDIDYYDWPDLISELMPKCVNLEELKLILSGDEPNDRISQRVQYERVMGCWDLLPATVKVINVLVYGWKPSEEKPLNLMKLETL